MAKHGDMLETIVHVLGLLDRIPRKSKVTAKELHEQLKDAGMERNLRTIQRQLEILSQEFDIERDDRSKPYGYCWKENAKGISLPGLDAQESLLLGLAEEHLRNLLPVRLMKSMDGFFKQARRNLGPGSTNWREREWRNKVRVVATSQPLLPPEIKPEVLEAVSNALYDNHWLKLNYRNRQGKESNPKVMPLGLVQQGPSLYLVCRYDGYDNERNLALHRIQSAQLSTRTFKRPEKFDLRKYDDDGRFGYGEGRKIRLTFHISRDTGAHLLETQLSTDQTVKEFEDSYRISATVTDSKMLEWWLRGFGDDVWGVRKYAKPTA